jgi:transcriptional regulator with XRE-family HTH domain
MTTDIRAVLGQNIRRFRTDKGWSQERLALEVGIHRTYIGGIERGERNVSVANVQRIADGLGVFAFELLKPPVSAGNP